MATRPFTLNRRSFLVGSGGALISLPLLEAMFPGRALAAGAGDPKRFVCMYIPNGTYIAPNNGANWFPGTEGPLNASALPITWQPFSTNVADFSIFKNINNRAASQGHVGAMHSRGISCFLTCSYASDNTAICTIAADSFDQIAAQKLTVNNGKPLLMCGGAIGDQVADGTKFHYGEFLSYRGGKEAAPYKNPVSLFTDMFAAFVSPGGGSPALGGSARTLAKNKSVLDNAVSDIAALQARLGSSDRQKLDDYLTSLRSLEAQMSASTVAPTSGAACGQMAAPAATLDNEDFYGDRLDFAERLQAFNDMTVLAFKCDLVRSVAITFDTEAAARKFKNKVPANLVYQGVDMGDQGSHLGMSHYAGDSTKPARCVTRDRFYLSYFFSLMDQLKLAKDPSGAPILDNTIILSGHGIIDGNHSSPRTGLPLVLGGGKNLGTHPGMSYQGGGDMSDLLFTIGAKLGLGLTSFQGSSKAIPI
jgi:Protein of unknown function (DUF1552)